MGGGVVGLATALELRRAGAEVVLVERGACGEGASAGNTGWVTPAFSAPLAAPGTVLRALRWMFDPNSPFLVRPRLDPAFLRWAWRFARSTKPATYRAGIEALAGLGERVFDDFDRLRDSGVAFEMRSPGLFFLAFERGALDEYAHTLETLIALGYPSTGIEELDGDAARAREPAIGPAVEATLVASLERCVRPETLCAGLLGALRDAGAEVREHEEVTGLRPSGVRWLLATPKEEIAADKVVVAAGAWSGRALRHLVKSIPIEAAKGYSVTTRVQGPIAAHTLYFTEVKIAYTPFGDEVRLAGTLELAGLDTSLRRSRVELLTRTAARYLRDWRTDGGGMEWAGLRPLAADGLPVIGELPDRPGAFLATGHGTLGITLAPTTAAALAPVVLGESDGREIAAFSPARFRR